MGKKLYKRLQNRKMAHIFKVIVIIILLVFVGFVLTLEPRMPHYESYIPKAINDGWVQDIEGELYRLESVKDVVDVDGDVILMRILPEIQKGEILLYYSQNQEIFVYVEDELIYEFQMRESMQFLESPGNLWNEVPLDSSMSGKQIRIDIRCDASRYASQVGSVYLTHNSGKALVELEQSWFQTVVGILVLLMAVFGYVRGHQVTELERKRRLYLTSDLYAWIGMWILAECSFIDILLRRPTISYVVGMLAIRVIPIVFISVVLIDEKAYVERLKALRFILWLNLMLSIVLQFVCGVSFLDTLAVNTLLLFMTSVVCISYFFKNLWQGGKDLWKDNIFLCCFYVFLGGMVDMLVYTIDQHYTKGIGIGTCMAMLFFTGIQFVSYIRKKRELEERTIVLERELDLVRYTVMVKQMNSHFLNNTLNGISALCKLNPMEADKAIKALSKYLRLNIYLIEQECAIPFQKEMELVEAYLSIEKMRFEDRFEVQLDLKFLDFYVPSLTIQPVIENALVHGLKDRVSGGRVVVTSERVGDFAKVCIEDNGAGFSPEDLESGNSLGIKNIANRINLIANGSVEIYSELQKGTKIVYSVPVSLEESYKEVK